MVDIATFAQNQGRLEPFNVLAQAENLDFLRQRNQAFRSQEEQQNALRDALAGGDVNAIARIDPTSAGEVFDLNKSQQLQAATRMMTHAGRVVSSASPKDMLDVLRNDKSFAQDAELLGMDFSQLGDIEGLDDEVIRNEALNFQNAMSSFLTGGPMGLISDPSIPSRVRNALAFSGLPSTGEGGELIPPGPMTREDFIEANRAFPIEELGGVQRQVLTGGATRQLETLPEKTSAVEALQRAEKQGERGGLDLTPGELAIDQQFKETFVEWNAAGGFADISKQIEQLDTVIADLKDPNKNLTGGFIGETPDFILARTNPQALNAKDLVEDVVQRNLRLILGAQFTEKEGERLIARAYNPRLEESDNLARVTRLRKSMMASAKAKQAAVDYFGEERTLKGFTGKVPNLGDIKVDDEEELPEGVTEEEIQFTMEKHGMTREQVLEIVKRGQR